MENEEEIYALQVPASHDRDLNTPGGSERTKRVETLKSEQVINMSSDTSIEHGSSVAASLKRGRQYNHTVENVRILNIKATFVQGRQAPRLKDPHGNIFLRHVVKNSDTTYWHCIYKRRTGCPAKAVTRGDVLEKLMHFHTNHAYFRKTW